MSLRTFLLLAAAVGAGTDTVPRVAVIGTPPRPPAPPPPTFTPEERAAAEARRDERIRQKAEEDRAAKQREADAQHARLMASRKTYADAVAKRERRVARNKKLAAGDGT